MVRESALLAWDVLQLVVFEDAETHGGGGWCREDVVRQRALECIICALLERRKKKRSVSGGNKCGCTLLPRWRVRMGAAVRARSSRPMREQGNDWSVPRAR